MPDEDRLSQLIVIGSSAGGIDALSVVMSKLPADLPVPIIVAQHLDPRRPSRLVEILQRTTRLSVDEVTDSAQLTPGHVLVVPPNRDAHVADGRVVVKEPADGRSKPSIDKLFESAAHAYGEGLIAVILTGTGTDGAAGAKEVKAAGGTIVIQNPETASYPGMPHAVPPSSVDVVAELDALGPLLHDLVIGAFVPSLPDEERVLRGFLDQVRERSGIDFSAYKRPTILRRIQRRMAATGSARLRDYINYVRVNPDELQRLSSSFLIKVTEFFRDADLFSALRDEIVPQIVEEARSRQNEIRVWSAGCATGEEAYSLAILFADALGPELAEFSVRIFATDVDSEAITFARRGSYPASALDGLPADLVDRHFSAIDDHYEVTKGIRALTVFGQHDLGQRAPFPRVDLAVCRNVLIYFTGELQRRALQLFAFSLRDRGYLVLGKAESTTPLPEYFVLEQPRLKIYRRSGDRVLIPPARIKDSAPLPPVRPPALRRGWIEPAAVRQQRDMSRIPAAAEKAESLLLRLPVGVVVIDRRYDIQTINSSARRLLSIHGAAIGEDFVHLLPESAAAEIKAAVDGTFRGEPSIAIHDLPLATAEGPEIRTIQISCHLLSSDVTGEPAVTVLVMVTDITAAARSRQKAEEELERGSVEKRGLHDQARLLTASNAALLEANQELTTSNAELRTANEELLVANEEVQAATEEVETLNEELQATNEELETLNEELQATVEELNTTNDDLQARGNELQEAAASLSIERDLFQRERDQLMSILDSSDDAVAIVATDGSIAFSSARYRGEFGDGLPIDDQGTPLALGGNGRRRARGGMVTEATAYSALNSTRWQLVIRPIEMKGERHTVITLRPA